MFKLTSLSAVATQRRIEIPGTAWFPTTRSLGEWSEQHEPPLDSEGKQRRLTLREIHDLTADRESTHRSSGSL